MSLDGWWYEACLYHDWAYYKIRRLKEEYKARKHIQAYAKKYPENTTITPTFLQQTKNIKAQIKEDKRLADWALKRNIRICSGKNVLKYLIAWFISRHYYRAVRLFGKLAL